MKNDGRNPGDILDSGIAAMRGKSATGSQIQESSSRVLRHLRSEHAKVVQHPAAAEAQGIERIQSCGDFRALIPAYLSSSLTPSRKLLFDDHMHECVLCRKTLDEARRGPAASSRAVADGHRSRKFRLAVQWASVAAVAAGIVLAFQTAAVRDFISPTDVHAMVQTVEGGLYRVQDQEVQPIAAGQRVERSQVVRTGNSSGAILQLADGSRIEMNSRSELFLDRAKDGVRINVNRGNVIVTAAKQKNGHLYAATKELGVSVVGTVFQVNAGVKGSRVTVIEGEVRVQQGQSTQALRPGQQFSTDPAMGAIPASEEISWSREVAKYVELLKIAQDASIRVSAVEMRHTSDLVTLVPESTAIFASLPNITQTIAQSYAVLKQRVTENEVLADWWRQNAKAPVAGLTIDQIIERLTRAGKYLGTEVILAFPKELDHESPVVLADVTLPLELASMLQDSGIRVVLTPEQLQPLVGSRGPVVFVGQGLMIIAEANQILRSLAFRAGTAHNSFASTSLYARLAQAYTEGVGWLLAADLERLIGKEANNTRLQQLGIADMQQFIAEQKTGPGGGSYRATLGFKQNRRGMASWLAPPSPMGALEFISPNAFGAAGIVTKDPSSMFEDIFSIISGENAGAVQNLQNYQAQHRVDIRRDLIAPLGNEILIAVDGPILPTPAWRIVIEVNDAARLQNTIEWSVADMSREAAARQEEGARITSETIGGKTFYSLAGSKFPTQIHYTYWAGYMIIAPSRAMLMESIQNHDTGNTLMRSAAFRSQLPADGRDYASGFVYQNIQAMTSALPVDVLKQTAVDTIPSLVCIYGESDLITMSSKGVLGMNIASMAGLTGMLKAGGVTRNSLNSFIELDALNVHLGGRLILKDLAGTFSGRCIGLLGPNGAGKTTLLQTLLGFHPPTTGTAHILGLDVRTQIREIRHQIGYMPETDSYIAGMTAIRFVRMMAELSGLPSEAALERAHETLFYVGLGEARYRKLGTYSLGMKQMAKLAVAIVHGPHMLILDEPTNGLDPPGRQRMIQLVKEIRDTREINLIISSHLLRDIEECCDEVMIMKEGRIANYCNLEEQRRANRKFLQVETRGENGGFLEAVEKLGCECAVDQRTHRIKMVLPEAVEIRNLYELAEAHTIQIRRLDYKRDSLQDIFLKAMETREESNGHGGL